MTTTNPKTIIAEFTYGGILPQTHSCSLRDAVRAAGFAGKHQMLNELQQAGLILPDAVKQLAPHWPVTVWQPHGDALIERLRSMVARDFLKSDGEVLIMLDHDLEWQEAREDYEGDLLRVARICAEKRSIVGAAVSKKSKNQGVASMIRAEDMGRELDFGGPGASILDVHYVGSAFTAYHRDVLEAVTARSEIYPGQPMQVVAPGFAPVFATICVPHPYDTRQLLHLSEDWAFCHRAASLGFKTWLDMAPRVYHWGSYRYGVEEDSQQPPPPEFAEQHYNALAKTGATAAAAAPQVTISLLHATRGRKNAAEVWPLWQQRASGACRLEYVLSWDVDDDAGARVSEVAPPGTVFTSGYSRGNVDAYNRAAYASTGDVLVQVHDDVEPPQDWDRLLVQRIGDVSKPVVLRISDGLPPAVNGGRKICTILVGTRAFFKRAGHFYWPGYVSVFCDDDVTEKARKEGVLIDAEEIVFKHNYGGHDKDATTKRSYRPENWALGESMLKMRRAAGFPDAPELWRGK